MTMDGHLLWSERPAESRHVASTIKMLNALVVMDHARLTDVVVVSKAAEMSNGGVGLVGGQRLTVSQLLNIMLVHSANDAARALAIHVAGSQPRFVAMMNAKAASLGLTHTHAVDPDGFSSREVSDAEDLAVLGRHVMADPMLRAIVGQSSVPVPRMNGRTVVFASSDLMMGHYAGLEGIKTGFTSGAGFCYVGAAKRRGVELLGVVLGTQSEAARFGQMRKLFDWGFAHCRVEQLVPAGVTRTVNVGGHLVTARTAGAASGVVFDGGGSIRIQTVAIPSGGEPSPKSEHVADLVVSQDGDVLARVPLLSGSLATGGTNAWVGWLLGLLAALIVAALGAAALVARGPLIAWACGRPPRSRRARLR